MTIEPLLKINSEVGNASCWIDGPQFLQDCFRDPPIKNPPYPSAPARGRAGVEMSAARATK